MEELVCFDAGGGVFDFGIFETEVGIGLATGSKYDAIDANHFFDVVVLEDNTFGHVVLFEGDNFAVWQNHNAEHISEIICDSLASVGIFVWEQARGFFHNDGFSAKFGIVFGNFAAGGPTTNDNSNFRQTADFDGGFWRKIVDGVGAGDSGSIEMRTRGNDKILGGEFLIANGNSVAI